MSFFKNITQLLLCLHLTGAPISLCFAGLPAQIDVDRAQHNVDKNGIPTLTTQDHSNNSLIKGFIRKASSTYRENGFDVAFNQDSTDNYAAGMLGEKSSFVNIELDRSIDLTTLDIVWLEGGHYAKKIKVSTYNESGEKIDEIISTFKKSKPSFSIKINSKKTKNIELNFSDFVGQPRMLIKKIIFKSKSNILNIKVGEYIPEIFSLDENSEIDRTAIFLGPNDDKNPLKKYRKPISMRIKKLSDRLSSGCKTDHEKIIRFMEYIGHFKVGTSSNKDLDNLFDEKIGACGEFSNALLALSACQNIDGRHINFCNYPKNDGHTVTEIKTDGKWRVYDPTFAAYYIKNDENNKQPLSFKSIRNSYKNNPEVIDVVSHLYREGFNDYTGKNIFLRAMPCGVIGYTESFFYPLTLDIKKQLHLERKDFGPQNQGADFLGVADTNNNQTWSLKNLTPGKTYEFSIHPELIGGDIEISDDKKFIIKAAIKSGAKPLVTNHSFDCSQKDIAPLTIKFIADASVVTLELSHAYRGPNHRYLSMKKYEIKEL